MALIEGRFELDEVRRALGAASEEAHRLIEGMDDEQARWRPVPGRWNVLQCLDHLARTNREYASRLDAALVRARPGRGEGLEASMFERWFLSQLEPPPRNRFSAPKAFRPDEDDGGAARLSRESALSEFVEAQNAVLERLERAREVDLRSARVASPATSLIRFRLGAVFEIIAAHDRRHLWQAARLRTSPGSPKGREE